MTTRAILLSLAVLAGCATSAPPPPAPGVAAAPEAAPGAPTSPTASAGPSDWALAIVGTPFVFAFRTVVCAATAVVAAPTAGLLAFSEERQAGMAYLRDGLAENCGPPYAVGVPVAGHYEQDPDLAGPRPLMPDDDPPGAGPRRLAAAVPVTAGD